MSERFSVKFAVYLLLRDGDRVLLSKRENTGWKDGWWSLVAGHVDGGEAAEMAMIREAKEEAGIDVAPENLKLVYTMHRLSNEVTDEYVDLFFECTEWSGEITNMEPQKCGGLEWFSANTLPNDTLGYIKKVIDSYPKGMTYSSEEKE
jgi:8-oxo-dGTP pyrophosphatase MutT (NUDIX family)